MGREREKEEFRVEPCEERFSRDIRAKKREGRLTRGWKDEELESAYISVGMSLTELMGGASSSARGCRCLGGNSEETREKRYTTHLELWNIESIPKSDEGPREKA